MKRRAPRIPMFLCLVLALTCASQAQLAPGAGIADSTSDPPASSRTFSFSGSIPGQLDGALSVTFSIYPDQQSTTALWTETQVVQVTGEKYSVMLGSTSATGLPQDIFSADQAHWLGVLVNGGEKRYLLVSVPYAMKAVEAERLGGLLPSDFVTVQQLQSALQSAAAPGTPTQPKATSTGPTGQAAATGTPPQPATDFTDNNGTEVLLVTQLGPGYAIHAISNLQPAIYAENKALIGTALQVVETSTDGGASTGLFAQTLGSGSIAGVFDSAGPAILELRKSGTRMVFFDQFGDMTANGEVRASDFAGSGSGLTNIPNSATTATPLNSNNTIVARDFNGGFVAGTVQASSFVGSGFGLTDIPNSATTATPLNSNNTIVARDFTGAFSASVITAANFFSGSGAGLTNIPPSAINATFQNLPNSVVARDPTGSFAANQIFGTTFNGSGAGLTDIPPSAINATFLNLPNSVVARDPTGSFAANQIFGTTFNGSGAGLTNIPPSAINATFQNLPNSVVARDPTGSFAANQIFGTTFNGSGAGLTNIPPAAINATNGAFPNSVVARDPTGSFAGNQIFANTFFGDGSGLSNIPPAAVNATPNPIANSVVARDASAGFSAASINVNNLFANAFNGTAIQGSAAGNAVGIQAATQNGFGLWAGATANDSTGTALLLSHASQGKLISGGVGSDTNIFETFSVGASGDVSFNGAMMTPYETSGTWFASSLVKLTSIPGNFGAGTVAMTSPGDTSGAIGIISGLPASGSRIQVVQSGQFFCNFDGPATSGDYVGISKTTAGDCADIGASYPTDGQQVVGRVLSSFVTGTGRVLLFQSELHNGGGSSVAINTGAGLTGGPISGSGTISIANSGVTNAMLQNSSVFVTAGAGLSGGGAVPLGGSLTLSNTGVLAFNGRTGNIVPSIGDYSFSQVSGAATSAQLPIDVAYTSKSNTFGTDQFVQGNMAVTGNLTSPNLAAGKGSFSGFATPASPVLSVTDNGNSSAALSVNSVSTDPAAVFTAAGTTVLLAGPSTGATTILSTSGNLSLQGTATAHAFSGDGSALTNVSATKIGTLSQADIATNAALSAETSARQSADTTLQSNIDSETAARQAADTTLQSNITAETSARQTDVANVQASIGAESLARQSVEASLLSSLSAEITARQSDVSTLQTNINNVSAADAKLAASNTFTAGTQDFSSAEATLPVRSVLAANTPAACIAGKELLIKTDAPAGQQLFICDASGTTWNLVGDGVANGVSSFNGRNGTVSPASGDYSFAQISGSAVASQLPATVAYNNQSNTFTGNQTVNGSVTATSFSGSGSGLTGVNAASLNGIPSNAFAQLHAINSFTSEQAFAASTAVNPSLNIPAGVAPATPLAGDVWNTGSVLQYRDNASTTRSLVSTTQSGGLQLLKLSASITPANVNSQACIEQSFTVSGINPGDMLLGVSQPSTSSPGTNIAIGGFRVSAANTVAVQFCNVSRNGSTPTSGVYTFALMR